jgi:adenosylhomocysteine nucleosidase
MPTENTLSVPCVVFALRREALYFRRTYPLQQCFPDAPCHAELRGVQGTDVLMLETGVGAAAMATALRWCLSSLRFGERPYRPRLLVSAGFSGALQPQQHVGDLVLATEVIDLQGHRWPAICPSALAGCNIAAGRLLTAPELVSDPQQKQRLGRQYEALAVDMESAVAARLCRQHHVPFACLRVISDDCYTALSPQVVALLHRGSISIALLATQLLRRPKLIGELGRLARQTRHAAQKLLAPLSAVVRDG